MKTDDVIVTALPCPPACTLSWPVMDANDSSGRGALLVKHGCRTLMRYMPRTVRDTGREREWERTKCGFSVPFRVSLPILVKTRHKARTSTLWYFAFALCCHSNETRAPISNPPNSVQLGGTPTTLPSYIPVRAVVWAFGRGQNHMTDRQTDTQKRVTNIHFASSTTHAKCTNSRSGYMSQHSWSRLLRLSIHRLTVTKFLHTISMPAVFPPWCGASSATCLLLWPNFPSKIVIIRTFS